MDIRQLQVDGVDEHQRVEPVINEERKIVAEINRCTKRPHPFCDGYRTPHGRLLCITESTIIKGGVG